MNGRIALLLPTRGRPASLRRTIDSIGATASRRDEVVVVVGVDDDDEATLELATRYRPDIPILWSAGPQERTLGHLWNRLAAAEHGCDVLAMQTDDNVMETPGWDEHYRGAASDMPLGFGTAWPHDVLHGPDFCTAPVITRRMMERMGFFVPPWFPYWFHDTWLEEMGAFVACRLPLSVRLGSPDGRGSTQNMRDFAFWSAFFDATRVLRMRLALQLIDEMYAGQRALRLSLRFGMRAVAMFYAGRNRQIVTMERAAAASRETSAQAAPTPRYLAARRDAEALLASLPSALP